MSLANSVNQMAASLAKAQGAQSQFLMSVSHDLRTPLTSIRGFAEAISDGATDDVQYAAGVIGSEARRLERLVSGPARTGQAGVGRLQPALLARSTSPRW